MENKKIIDGLEFLYAVTNEDGYNQYYEGYTLSTKFDSDIEIGDTSLEDVVIQAEDVEPYRVEKIINKLNSEKFYSTFLKDLQQDHLQPIKQHEKYTITIGLGCRGEQHFLHDVTTKSIIELHQYLKKEFNVK